MHENVDGLGAVSIADFCRRNAIGITTAYAEIAAGRLIARKCRSRTIIALEDERLWRDSLPRLGPDRTGERPRKHAAKTTARRPRQRAPAVP
jgi:hypothetical protein